MAAGDSPLKSVKTAKKTTAAAKGSGRKAATRAKSAADTATRSTKKAAGRATRSTKKAAGRVTETAGKVTGSARATRAARAGLVDDARSIAAEADLGEGMAAKAIAEAEEMHYQVEVNKRGLSVSNLTKVLNQRWENGWRLAHTFEQRGNTVLVFEKRS